MILYPDRTLTRLRTRMDRVRELWAMRPCFVCERKGCCPHRELAVELAIVDVELARASKPARREPQLAVALRRKRA